MKISSMCGIVGYIGTGDRETLERMTGRLRHRGPDDGGIFQSAGAGLGFRRLAVIDLAGGRQPMTNADNTVHLVFNGEIYNFRELRRELERKYHFATASDTEVILHLYEEEGEKAFERLWGMFALAVWDERERKLILARDRLGKKPLYVWRHSGGLVFASELKALIEHPSFKKTLDLGALSFYLAADYLPTRQSIFADVEKLPPAHFGVWKDGHWSERRYWTLPAATASDMSEHDALEALEGLLTDAVRRRMVADVPVGVFLSGGVDSSLVAAVAAKSAGRQLSTFTIGFREKSFDESAYAREVASRLGSDHHELIFDSDESVGFFNEVGTFLDEPFADPSILPTYLLSKITRERVTVALSGDGGDEVFWGYASFRAHRVADWIERLPAALRRRWLPWIVRRLPSSDRYMSLPFVAERFVRGADRSPLERDRLWRSAIGTDLQNELFRPEAMEQVRATTAAAEPWEAEWSAVPWKQMAASYLFDYLPNDILYKADRASMAASLEVRSPLLDHRIVEFGWTLPDRLKLRGLTTKYLLKKLLERHMPSRVAHRPKQGFALPVAAWLRGPLKERCETYFSKSFQDRLGLFRPETVRHWWDEHLDRRHDRRKELWSLLTFCHWWEIWFIEAISVASGSAPCYASSHRSDRYGITKRK